MLVVEHLLSTCEVLSLAHSTEKKKKKAGRGNVEKFALRTRRKQFSMFWVQNKEFYYDVFSSHIIYLDCIHPSPITFFYSWPPNLKIKSNI